VAGMPGDTVACVPLERWDIETEGECVCTPVILSGSAGTSRQRVGVVARLPNFQGAQGH